MLRSGIMRLEEGGVVPWYVNIFGTKGEGESAEEKARREFLEGWFENHSLAVPVGQENYDPFAGDPAKEYELWLAYDALYPGTVPDPTTSTDTNGVDTNGVDTNGVDTNGVDTNGVDTNGVDTNGVDTNGVDTNGVDMEEITVVEKLPTAPGIPGELVRWAGYVYIFDALKGWILSPDHIPGGPADNSTIEEIFATGKVPEGFDWEAALTGVGGVAGLASLLGWEGLGGGDEGGEDKDSLLSKIFDIWGDYQAIKDYKEYKVPTRQMDAQSAIGKQWGLPSKESMVMQGLGPNFLQGQKYVMDKGKATPAATHVGGLPLVEEKIEGGEQGGIMGLKSHGDITPAFLEPGEFVFTKKATDNIGAKRLYKLMKQAEQMGMR